VKPLRNSEGGASPALSHRGDVAMREEVRRPRCETASVRRNHRRWDAAARGVREVREDERARAVLTQRGTRSLTPDHGNHRTCAGLAFRSNRLAPGMATIRSALVGPGYPRSMVVKGLLLALLLSGCAASGSPSYNDGYAWGNASTVGVLLKTAPYCSPAEMTSSGPVVDPHWLFEKPTGAGEPNDNFAQWFSGCMAGGLQALQDYCAGSPQFCPVVTPAWYQP